MKYFTINLFGFVITIKRKTVNVGDITKAEIAAGEGLDNIAELYGLTREIESDVELRGRIIKLINKLKKAGDTHE